MTTYELYLSKHAELTAKGRAHIKQKNFGIPSKAEGKKEKKQEGNYPIHDRAHARSALSYGSRYLSPSAYAALKKRVYAKYPGMKKSAADDDALTASAGTGERLLNGVLPYLHSRRMGELGAIAKAKGYQPGFLAEHPTLTTVGGGIPGAILGGGLGYAAGRAFGGSSPEASQQGGTVGALLGAGLGAGTSALLTNYLVGSSAERQLRQHAKDPLKPALAKAVAQDFADEDAVLNGIGGLFFGGKGSYDAGYKDMLERILQKRKLRPGISAAEVGKTLAGAIPYIGGPLAGGVGAYQSYASRKELKDLLRTLRHRGLA